jgi:hypothetical protein
MDKTLFVNDYKYGSSAKLLVYIEQIKCSQNQ